MPCGSDIPAITVSVRSFAAAGTWLASVAGVMPSLRTSSAKDKEENITALASNAILKEAVRRARETDCAGAEVSNVAK